MRSRALLLAACLALSSAPARAWDGHDSITRAALESLTWLDDYPALKVTPHSDRIDGIQPTYAFAFHGEQLGGTIPAREILIRYSEEPDWGLDQNLNASWQQTFMGGYTGLSSQAYFHMYYPPFTVHLPVPGIEMGVAPQRLELWARAAERAFERNDPYWGFRYLACALHYIEDVSQPYHATQTAYQFVDLHHPIAGTTKITGNYHFVYEGWVRRQIEQEALAEAAGGRPAFGFLAAIRGTGSVSFAARPDYVKKVARLSHQHASPLVKACVAFFDRRFKQPVDVTASEADLTQLEPAGPRRAMVAETVPALGLTGRSIRGFLAHMHPRLNAWMRDHVHVARFR